MSDTAFDHLAHLRKLEAEIEQLRAFAMRVLSGHSVVSEMRADAAQVLGPWEALDE